jgi:stearoyl-CoA desaturase (delta-9 desaturase)
MKNLFVANTKYFTTIQILLSIILLSYIIIFDYSWLWLIAGVFGYFLTGCLGITLTFHRYLSHKSFKMPRWLEYLFTFFGCMGGTGSSIGWVAIHRQHHKHSDNENDPHSPRHQGWKVLFPSYITNGNKFTIRDLITNKYHFFLHKYYFLILISWGLLLSLFFGLPGFIFLFCMPIVCQVWVSVLSNYVNHSEWFPGGYKNFNIKDDSINHFLIALISWGEGWHNNHHNNTRNYTFKEKWWEFDLTAFIIDLIRTDKKIKNV